MIKEKLSKLLLERQKLSDEYFRAIGLIDQQVMNLRRQCPFCVARYNSFLDKGCVDTVVQEVDYNDRPYEVYVCGYCGHRRIHEE